MIFLLIRTYRELFTDLKTRSWYFALFKYIKVFSFHIFDIVRHRFLFYKHFKKDIFSTSKKCIYTVLINNYDDLKDPKFITPGWDYLCFTNLKNLSSSCWKFIYVENTEDLDPVRLNRKYKCLNHLIDTSYDYSIYIDSNIHILDNLDHFLNSTISRSTDIAIVYHKHRYSVQQELAACIKNKKDDSTKLQSQIDFYKENDHFQDKMMLTWNALIVRKTNSTYLKAFMESWFSELKKWSFRDQISFCPTFLKHSQNISFNYIPHWKFNNCFVVNKHIHQRR